MTGVDEAPATDEDAPGIDEDVPCVNEPAAEGEGAPGVVEMTVAGIDTPDVVGSGPMEDAGRLGALVELMIWELTSEYEGTTPSSGTCTALTAPGTSVVPFT
jgi:hypothetical protein